MTKQVADSTASDRSVSRSVSAWEVWATLIDTSARLFIPSVGGTVGGLWLDLRIGTKPWFTIIGVLLGTLVAFSLVYLQIKAINKEKPRT